MDAKEALACRVFAAGAPTMPSPEALYAKAEDTHQILAALAEVSVRHQHVLRWRYGLEDGREWSRKEIGYALGVSPSRAANMLSEALSAVRAVIARSEAPAQSVRALPPRPWGADDTARVDAALARLREAERRNPRNLVVVDRPADVTWTYEITPRADGCGVYQNGAGANGWRGQRFLGIAWYDVTAAVWLLNDDYVDDPALEAALNAAREEELR